MFQFCWTLKFTTNAHRINIENKNSVRIVPLTEDMSKITMQLKAVIETQVKELRQCSTDTGAFMELQKALLSLIILFNRRRSGAVSRMTLAEYKKGNQRQHVVTEDDLPLSDLERQFMATFTRIERCGKKTRTVPVLLTASMKDALDLLVRVRKGAGVADDNKHFFAIAKETSKGYVRGWEALKQFSEV